MGSLIQIIARQGQFIYQINLSDFDILSLSLYKFWIKYSNINCRNQ